MKSIQAVLELRICHSNLRHKLCDQPIFAIKEDINFKFLPHSSVAKANGKLYSLIAQLKTLLHQTCEEDSIASWCCKWKASNSVCWQIGNSGLRADTNSRMPQSYWEWTKLRLRTLFKQSHGHPVADADCVSSYTWGESFVFRPLRIFVSIHEFQYMQVYLHNEESTS